MQFTNAMDGCSGGIHIDQMAVRIGHDDPLGQLIERGQKQVLRFLVCTLK